MSRGQPRRGDRRAGGESDRAVSETVGFILILGILVISWSVYQGVVVPEQNRAAEFEHNRAVQGELQDLHNAILTSAATGATQTAPVTLGATYPRRALALNLAASAGSIGTDDPGGASTVRLEGAVAVDPHGEVDDYWNGSAHAFESRAVVYDPAYARYSAAPETIYENTVVYNHFPGGETVVLADQSLVDDRRLSLIALGGELDENGQGAASVTAAPVSAATSAIAVRNETAPVVVVVPTALSVDTWEALLDDELDDNGGHVESVTAGESGTVEIALEAGVTYELRAGAVDVGGAEPAPGAAYLAAVDVPGPTVTEETTHAVVVEVRDRFNNPVTDVTVEGEVEVSDLDDDPEFDNGEDTQTVNSSVGGEARFEFTSGGLTGGAQGQQEDVTLTFTIGDDAAHETVEMNVTVIGQPGNQGG